MLLRCVYLLLSIVLTACEITPETHQLMERNRALEGQLANAQQDIRSLKAEQGILAKDNTELKRVMAILDTEKTSRATESANLRLQIRKFTQTQIDNLKEFLVQSNLLDYIGEELFDRTKLDLEPGVLIDLANPIPRNGLLVGVNGYFSQATNLVVNVIRPLNDRFVVIWQSQSIDVTEAGNRRIRFPISVGIEKGDVIAYDFPAGVAVKYDQGTGETALSKRSYVLGTFIDPSSLQAEEEKRAYSMGVIAILK